MFLGRGGPSHRHVYLNAFHPLETQLGPGARAELQSLAGERDPQMYLEGMLALGGRLEQAGETPAAARVYSTLLTPHPRGEKSEGSIQIRARQRLEALTGVGALGPRAEFLLQQMSRQILDPAPLAGMFAASAAFRLTRLVALGRMVPPLRANALAFGAEALAFPLGTRLAATALGRELNWNPAQVGGEFASSFLLLGAMRLTGLAINSPSFVRRGLGGGRGFEATARSRLLPLPVPPALSARGGSVLWRTKGRGLISQGAMFGGILLGHRLEEFLGLRPHRDGATTLTDSLALLLQFQIAGHLGGRLWGRGLESALPLREYPRLGIGLLNWEISSRMAPAWAGATGPRIPEPTPRLPLRLEMSSLSGPKGSDILNNPQLLAPILEQKWGLAPGHPGLQRILQDAGQIPFHFQEEASRRLLFDLLGKSQLRSILLPDGRVVSELTIRERAMRVFRYVQELNPLRRATGSSYDYLMQVALEQVLRSDPKVPKVHAFDQLMRIAAVNRKLSDLEKFFEDYSLKYPFQFRSGLWQVSLAGRATGLALLKRLPVTRRVRNILGNYLATFSFGEFTDPFRDPEYNYLVLRGKDGKPQRVALEGEFGLLALKNLWSHIQGNGPWLQMLRECLTRADQSRVPLLYLDRIFKILATGDLEEKLLEIAYPQSFDWDALTAPISVPDLDNSEAGKEIQGSVYTGYVEDPGLSEKFARFYQWLPTLLKPEERELRAGEFRQLARGLLEGRENYGREEVLEMLFHRPTVVAGRLREAILAGEVEFEVVSRETMDQLWKEKEGDKRFAEAPDGIFLPAADRPEGRPTIAVVQLDPALPREEKVAQAITLAAYTVHEGEHFFHFPELSFKKRSQFLRGEMRAWLEENFYLLFQGETGVWEKAKVLSPQGFGIYLRNLIDRDYLEGPRDLVWVKR